MSTSYTNLSNELEKLQVSMSFYFLLLVVVWVCPCSSPCPLWCTKCNIQICYRLHWTFIDLTDSQLSIFNSIELTLVFFSVRHWSHWSCISSLYHWTCTYSSFIIWVCDCSLYLFSALFIISVFLLIIFDVLDRIKLEITFQNKLVLVLLFLLTWYQVSLLASSLDQCITWLLQMDWVLFVIFYLTMAVK